MAPPSTTEEAEATLEEMLNTRLSVAAVKIHGATRTSLPLLNYLTSPVLSTGGTFSGVVDDISLAIERLRETGCFRGVDAYVDRAPLGADADVQFTLSEKKLYQFTAGTSMTTDGERETSLDTAFVWRNVRGRLDTLKASASWLGGGGPGSYGHQPSTSFDVHYTQPFVLGLDSSAFARVGQRFRNHLDHSSYTLNVRDCAVGVHLPLGRFSVNSAWREVAAVDDSASPLIREEAGHSWKTSLRHEVARDTRDHPAMPTSGALLSASTELTLPRLGDVAFAKGEAEAQTHVPLGASGAALALSARAGLVCSREGARVRVQDRFFLGGPNSMRGFDLRGVGPRDAADAVGGDTFYTVAAVLSTPVPQTSMLWQLFNARVHAFWCGGDLADISVVSKGVKRVMEGGGLQNKAKAGWGELQKSVRVAAGLGVALETSVGRVELNFCHVLRSAQSDVPSSKFQLGISESFW